MTSSSIQTLQKQTVSQRNNTGLPEHAVAQIKKVFAQYPNIQSVILYGSRAIGNYRNGSDIDLTILSNTLSHIQLANISMQLDDLMLPYSIDLSLYHTIQNPALIAHIEQLGKLFYQAGHDTSGSQ